MTFSGKRAIRLGQQVQYITERCVLELTPDGLLVTEIAQVLILNATFSPKAMPHSVWQTISN
ncbi:hypothetical protein MUTS15_03010 [Escherichia coli]|nr:hypothetical protein MUTS15_03010 [Escherichia coli]